MLFVFRCRLGVLLQMISRSIRGASDLTSLSPQRSFNQAHRVIRFGVAQHAMSADLALHSVSVAWIACLALVVVGAAVQVAVGAGLSVVCGPFLLLWVGSAIGVPILLCLNLLISVVATACGLSGVRWGDVALASCATLAGCAAGLVVPSLPDAVLKAMTACVLIAVALPRPPAPERRPSAASIRAGVGLAGLVTGALTVWTATPGPITPVALPRAGRSGSDIRRTMQPISIVGYGAALAWVDPSPISAFGTAAFAWLIGAVLVGTGLGFRLRQIIDPTRIVLLVRIVAAAAAVLLFAALLL
jgi:uncharacterized protein